MRQINDPIQPGAEQILLPGLLSLPRPHRSPSLDHLEGKESQPPIRRNRKNNLQENRSAATQFRQKPLLGKAQSPISFNALEILHGRLFNDWWPAQRMASASSGLGIAPRVRVVSVCKAFLTHRIRLLTRILIDRPYLENQALPYR